MSMWMTTRSTPTTCRGRVFQMSKNGYMASASWVLTSVLGLVLPSSGAVSPATVSSLATMPRPGPSHPHPSRVAQVLTACELHCGCGRGWCRTPGTTRGALVRVRCCDGRTLSMSCCSDTTGPLRPGGCRTIRTCSVSGSACWPSRRRPGPLVRVRP